MLPLLFSTLLLCTLLTADRLAAQTTCAVGHVSLSTLPESTFTTGGISYTFNFCSPGYATQKNFTKCSTPGYLQLHNVSSGACIRSYQYVALGLTVQSSVGAFFLVADAPSASVNQANVTINCQRQGSSSLVTFSNVTSPTTTDGVTKFTVNLQSLAGCSLDSYICDSIVQCRDSTLSCTSGVCINPNCVSITSESFTTATPEAVTALIATRDCNGRPVVNASSLGLAMALNGINVNDTRLGVETISYLQPSPGLDLALVTTLLIDQSASVTSSTEQSAIITSMQTFVQTLINSQVTNHFVGVIAFDGSSATATVIAHTNNLRAVLSAIDTQLPPTILKDPESTNLYGAVITGIQQTYQMKYSFGNLTRSVSDIVTSMIVFTDGYDTAGRSTAVAAINEATTFANDLEIFSIGFAQTSDTAFLASISTSGYYNFLASLDGLTQPFVDIAKRLTVLSYATVFAAVCVPSRAPSNTLTFTINTTMFPGSNTLSLPFDASKFSSGCTGSTLRALAAARSTAGTQPIESLITLQVGYPITVAVLPQAAYYFTVGPYPSTASVSVTPAGFVYVMSTKSSKTCLLSTYCYDSSFNVSFLPTNGVFYHAMLVSSATTSTQTFTLTARYINTIPTPSPLTTLTPGSPPLVPLTATPGSAFTLAASTGYGDVDQGATIVFFVFGLLLLVAMVALFCLHCYTKDDYMRLSKLTGLHVPMMEKQQPQHAASLFALSEPLKSVPRLLVMPTPAVHYTPPEAYSAPQLFRGASPPNANPGPRRNLEHDLSPPRHTSGGPWAAPSSYGQPSIPHPSDMMMAASFQPQARGISSVSPPQRSYYPQPLAPHHEPMYSVAPFGGGAPMSIERTTQQSSPYHGGAYSGIRLGIDDM